VEELVETSRLYTLHCGVELNEQQPDGTAAAAAAVNQEMTYSDKQNHHLWLKSKAGR